MRVEIMNKGIDRSEVLENKITDVLDSASTIFGSDAKYRVVYRKEGRVKVVEITVNSKMGTFRAEKKADDFYIALHEANEAIWRSIRRVKAKNGKKRREKPENVVGVAEVVVPMVREKEITIGRHKVIEPKIITAEEAIEEMRRLGHSFYLFINKETGNSSLVYTREEDKYGEENFGLIEVEETGRIAELDA